MSAQVGSTKTKYFLVTLGVSAAACYGIWNFQASLIGTPPVEAFTPAQHAEKFDYQDPDIERLRGATKVRPDERGVWISLAKELLSKANKGVLDRQKASLEAVDALRQVLNLDPKDTEALIFMGDISFDLQAFPKALEFYGKYLEVKPEDDATRARYASTLTFMGRAEEARTMLLEVVERSPNAFQARAFLALAFAQLGEFEQVQIQGQKAIELAPDDESRERLKGFLSSFAERRGNLSANSSSVNQSTVPAKASAGKIPEPSGASASSVSLGQYIAKNPVAGPKVKDFKVDGTTFIIFVESFPMAQMPPFAKEKFFGGIKEFVAEEMITDFTAIRFVDLNTGKTEGELNL